MLILKSQLGRYLPDIVKEAIEICELLDMGGKSSVVQIQFNDINFCVNEKSTVQDTMNEVFNILKYKYACEGEVKNPTLYGGPYWMEDHLRKSI